MMNDQPDPAIPAATLIVLRDSGAGPFEMLMVERARDLAFAGGAMVFPGGRIDPDDIVLAARFDHHDAAARIGAIRETIEETGVAIGLVPAPSATQTARIRDALHAGTPLSRVLERSGRGLNLDVLTPFARWCPAHRLARRFDTMFYLAGLPNDAPHATADHRESMRTLWTSAERLLAADDGGALSLVFPTRRTIERLAQFATIGDALADAARYPIRTIVPWEETREGETYLCIPEDAGYPRTSAPVSATRRA